jgi:hypothetical protein
MKKMINRPGLNETVAINICTGLYCEYFFVFSWKIWDTLSIPRILNTNTYSECKFELFFGTEPFFFQKTIYYILIKNMEIQILCIALYGRQFFKFLKCISCYKINMIYKDIHNHEGIYFIFFPDPVLLREIVSDHFNVYNQLITFPIF